MTKKIETVEDDAGKATIYHRHPNGGGLLGPGAQAAEDSFIAASTYVEAGAAVTEDSKGAITREFRIKQHLMATVHGIQIRLT